MLDLIENLQATPIRDRGGFLSLQYSHYSRKREERFGLKGSAGVGNMFFIPEALESGMLMHIVFVQGRMEKEKGKTRSKEEIDELNKLYAPISDFLNLFGVITVENGDYHIAFEVPYKEQEEFVAMAEAIIKLCEKDFEDLTDAYKDRGKSREDIKKRCLQMLGVPQKKTEDESE